MKALPMQSTSAQTWLCSSPTGRRQGCAARGRRGGNVCLRSHEQLVGQQSSSCRFSPWGSANLTAHRAVPQVIWMKKHKHYEVPSYIKESLPHNSCTSYCGYSNTYDTAFTKGLCFWFAFQSYVPKSIFDNLIKDLILQEPLSFY